MKKKVLLSIVVLFSLFLVTGCQNSYDANDTKIKNISYNAPTDFVEMKKSEGKDSDSNGKNWISNRYTYDKYAIRVIWREGDSYKEYTKNSKLKYNDVKVNGELAHTSDSDKQFSYTIIDYKNDLYIFEYYGKKTDNGMKKYDDIIHSIRFKK